MNSKPNLAAKMGDGRNNTFSDQRLIEDPTQTKTEKQIKKPAIFMIGSQRSGSNWLRTMLDQREDLAGPHPPHIMRDFMPIIGKFGNLSDDSNYRILVDHVCTFVERNQVPWTDRHSQKIAFPRTLIFNEAKSSCARLELEPGCNQLDDELYLLSIFDAIMNYFTKVNGKEIWMCKSMGMSKFHKYLLKFYGIDRLRYIFLVRDPRDVAMSFMKTPVGDCHWYAIIKKWVKLQDQAIAILEECSDIIYEVHYDDLLEDKEKIINELYDFIGERKFGGLKKLFEKQASVMALASNSELANSAKCGNESLKAHTLSYQFKNLTRGQSFVAEQKEKWKHPETGLKQDELIIIESIAWEVMDYFFFPTHLVNKTVKPLVFSKEEVDEFNRLNQIGIDKMNEDLKRENIGDYERRIHQAQVLTFPPQLVSDENLWTAGDCTAGHDKKRAILANIFSDEANDEVKTNVRRLDSCKVYYGGYSRKGYYPMELSKKNQDSFDIRDLDDGKIFLGIYDGHGPHGEKCSQMCANLLGGFVQKNDCLLPTRELLAEAHREAHCLLLKSQSLDSSLSGTTSVVAVLDPEGFNVGHVGDSVAMLGSKDETRKPSKLLTNPHDLNRDDERSRVERSGGLILSTRDYEEYKKSQILPKECSAEGTDYSICRVWSKDLVNKPGCAFTRSLGDGIAHDVGVSDEMDFINITMEDGDILILASDGVTEYLDLDTCIGIARNHNDPTEAAKELVNRSIEEWATHSEYVDDVTAIVAYFVQE